MEYNNLDKELINDVPEIKWLYDEELKLWDEDPGQHIIFGDVFNPYLINLLKSNENNSLIRKLFVFLEKMANCNDILVQEVLVCHHLIFLFFDPYTL